MRIILNSAVPQFLKEEPYNVIMTDWSSAELNAVGSSPDYTDTNLILALTNFVSALGNRYDGDTRIGYIQLGLLGFWGEWHTWTGDPSTDSWIPDSTKVSRSLLCTMVTDHPLIWAFYVLIVKRVMNACIDDILSRGLS